MTGQLLQWFRKLPLKKLAGNGERGIRKLADRLDKAICRIDLELAGSRIMTDSKRLSFAGIFCLEDNYLMLCRGRLRVYLINTGFGGVHIKRLGELAEGLYTEQGMLQSDIGLLFATEAFCRYVPERMIGEGLSVAEVVTEEQMRRHLGELAGEGERLGGVGLGAIFLRTAAEAE